MATGEGTVITDGKGNYRIMKGGQWQPYTPSGGSVAKGGKFSPQAQAFLNNLSSQASNAAETGRVYDRAEKDLQTLRPGPYRGAFMQAATPEDNGGVLDRIGAVLIGGPARLLGAITPKETDAYQRLRGLQSQQVLQAQIAQKGPQTESDAARMMLTELSPSKTMAANKDIIEKGLEKTRREQAKAIWYTKFANKYGVNGVNEYGHTADWVWNNGADAITDRYVPRKGSGGSTIKVISRKKVSR